MTTTEAKGQNGQVSFDGVFVTIHRKGFLARASVGKGDKRIPLSSITAVQWKPAGAMVNGFIQFTVPGGNERRSRVGHQTHDAGHDENSVVFTRGQMPAFDALRQAIESVIAAGPTLAVPRPVGDISDELTKLAGLREQGVLTEDEFVAAKARLLS